MTVKETDIAIVGAGLVGLAASIALAKLGYSVTIVDAKDPAKVAPNYSQASWDQLIYAISPNNVAWLKELGAWQLLDPTRIGAMQAMEIWGDTASQPLTLLADDANADHLGLIVENSALMQALLRQVEAQSINTIFGARGDSITFNRNVGSNTNVSISLDNGATIKAKLLLAADGAHSWVRQQLNMRSQQKSYHQRAVVANFECEQSHTNIARQWFAKDAEEGNSILAWLPLPDNKISIVWSVSDTVAESLIQLSKEEFTQQVAQAGGNVLGSMQLITEPASFTLLMQQSAHMAQDNVVLIGDAAHQIHPMAGQGVNLGFRDVIDLIETLSSKRPVQSIVDPALLRSYERKRKSDAAKMLLLTDGLFRLFGSPSVIVRQARNYGLSAIDQAWIKKLLVENAVSL
jgi:ubiquinone biosynthesis UbiH/UbiF/VisC/COQ6 family hydroxylase